MTAIATATRSATGYAPRDDRSYRAFLTLEPQHDAVERALEQVTSWLRERRLDPPDLSTSGFTRLDPQRELAVVHHQTRHAHDFRIRLVETNPKTGEWVTSLATSCPAKGAGWLSIRVTNNLGIAAETPRLARYLLDVLHARDSGYPVVAGAPIIRADDVEELFEAVCDPDRNGLLYVAGTANDPTLFTPFTDLVEYVAKRFHGLAQAVILDPVATEAFNDLIGATHATTPWTIRTYDTEVDPAWEPDARRHRILSTKRIAAEPRSQIAAMLLRSARSHAATRQLPPGARAALRDLNRIEDRLLLDALYVGEPLQPAPSEVPETTASKKSAPEAPTRAATSETADPSRRAEDQVIAAEDASPRVPAQARDHQQDPPTASSPAREPAAVAATEAESPAETEQDPTEQVTEYLAVFEMVKQTLGISELTEDALQQALAAAASATHARTRQDTADRVSKELTERQTRIDTLEEQLDEARRVADDALVEQRLAEQERQAARDEALWLRRVLDKDGRHDEAWVPLPEDQTTQAPGSFEELLDRLPELEERGIFFTGDPRTTLGLDDNDTLGSIVSTAWDCLLVLADYIAAKKQGDYNGNLMTYLREPPSGYRAVSPKRLGEKESSSTLDQWAKDRVFPVPEEVNAEGAALMEAHFKLPHCGMVTPRIHFLDDTHQSGNVYVGYMGRHLRTKATN